MDQKSIFEQFIVSAGKYPDAIAIVDSKSSITYSQLLGKIGSISIQLYEFGCRREEIVPIISSGGADMVAGMFACLQVAATFVPIDISSPSERTVQMLEDLGSRIVLTDATSNIDHVLISGLNIIRPKSNVVCDRKRLLSDDSIIYGFFTSGSTGKPKCCLNTHLGLVNRFEFNTSVKMLNVGDSILQNSKHTFDPVLWQTLWPLTLGATVVIPERSGLLDIEKTIDTISHFNVVMTDIVPSVLTVLLDYLEHHPDKASKLESLMELFVGGEEASIQLLERVRGFLPWVRLTNTYGPTEAAIGMVYHHFDGTETSDIPLGKPIPGTIAVVLNQEFKPVEDGEIGQLAIGGACLGKGYYNDYSKTASVFKSIELTNGVKTVFLTGDRAVIQNERIYFRGRTDKQVKIQGVRVELKEIESTFEEHPEIIQFRVVPVFQHNKETTLVSFFTAHTGLTSKNLRLFAKDRLPREFIPRVFNQVSEFVTTTSGKIDRSVIRRMADEATFDRVKSNVKGLQELVQNLTGILVQVGENLFEAGLDSLNAIRLSLKIEENFSVKMSTSHLYENPTIEAIQNFLQNKTGQNVNEYSVFSKWQDIKISPKKIREKVLLTGATGYLGAQLLSYLSKEDGIDVICFIRSSNEAQAMSKLHKVALKFSLHNRINWDNVKTILGDFTLPGLGISERDRDWLLSTLTRVYNAAAEVNFVKPFYMLERTNVHAVVELAEIAASVPDCQFYHISSTTVIGGNGTYVDTPPTARDFGSMSSGYAQSKLAAELALQSISCNGFPVTIYRVGELMPSPTSSIPNSKSIVVCYLRTLAHIGIFPDDLDSLDYSPVDAAAKQIVHRNSDNKLVVGLANQNRTSLFNIVEGLNQSGANIVSAPKSHVFEAIRLSVSEGLAPEYVSIIWSLIRNLGADNHWPILSYSNKLSELIGPSGEWPEVSVNYLSQGLRHIYEARTSKAPTYASLSCE
ncbi:non-ribosomal peptide synthetase [Marinomonas transparens]|uniref:AMP-binding protein n=1 Tax=Marinomonas transparens TaxID=2795388 RepID=A0A934JMH0_9GAMM|nr:AMP-binding protein [Marinomonas transparens]MBJ7536729.1 AMP-binding protein [Marinomonas transparens]